MEVKHACYTMVTPHSFPSNLHFRPQDKFHAKRPVLSVTWIGVIPASPRHNVYESVTSVHSIVSLQKRYQKKAELLSKQCRIFFLNAPKNPSESIEALIHEANLIFTL